MRRRIFWHEGRGEAVGRQWYQGQRECVKCLFLRLAGSDLTWTRLAAFWNRVTDGSAQVLVDSCSARGEGVSFENDDFY